MKDEKVSFIAVDTTVFTWSGLHSGGSLSARRRGSLKLLPARLTFGNPRRHLPQCGSWAQACLPGCLSYVTAFAWKKNCFLKKQMATSRLWLNCGIEKLKCSVKNRAHLKKNSTFHCCHMFTRTSFHKWIYWNCTKTAVRFTWDSTFSTN